VLVRDLAQSLQKRCITYEPVTKKSAPSVLLHSNKEHTHKKIEVPSNCTPS
jgi:hypothetical protein